MNKAHYINNRQRLSEKLSGGIIILTGYGLLQKSHDISHSFVQESNFMYLCGIVEPNWKLIIDGTRQCSWLVAPDISNVHQIFDGSLSHDDAKSISGVDAVVGEEEASQIIRRLARNHTVVHTLSAPEDAKHFNFDLNPAIERNRVALGRVFVNVQDCRKQLSAMRAIKQPEELTAITKAVDISIKSFESIRANMHSFKNEYEIEAEFAHAIRRAGADGCAYDSIVASGKNACTLHYSTNAAKLSARHLVLMDMGAQYSGYAADITRTYAKGEPTKRQREVHRAVESVHHQIIDLIAPMVSVESYQRDVDAIMAEALRSIGLRSDQEGVRSYFPHAISHGLGIDVHDSLGGPKYFQENMVLTVEPGIYIPDEGIGVRIEDDILITKTGRSNLSGKLSTGL